MQAHRLRGLMVISEVALAVVALVGAALFVKSFERARAVDPGFSPDGVALAQFDFSTPGITRSRPRHFAAVCGKRLEQLPGVNAVSYDDSCRLASMEETGRPLKSKVMFRVRTRT